MRSGKLVKPGYPNPQAEGVKSEILPVEYMILGAGEMSLTSVNRLTEETDMFKQLGTSDIKCIKL